MHPRTRESLQSAIVHSLAVPQQDTAAVLDALQPCVLGGGEWLFRQGDEGDCLYLLARGRLQVWIDPSEPGEHQPSLIAEVGPGETVGEISLLTGGRRSAGIRAVRDSLLLRMDAATFDRLGRERPQLVRQLAGRVAERLRDRTAGSSGIRRGFRTIALLSLGGAGTAGFPAELATALAPRGSTQLLTAARLAALDAPPLPAAQEQAVSAAFTDWLAAQEEQHHFLLLAADGSDAAWTRLVTRHADAILLLVDAADDPRPAPLEQALAPAAGERGAMRALVLCHDGQPPRLERTGAWLAARQVDHHFHLRSGVPGDLERLVRMLAGESIGLVLGGGAARGFAHLGVYAALAEAGVPVDWVGGASIGAVLGAPIALGLAPAEAIAQARAAFVDGRPFGDFTLPVLSLLRGRRMERLIETHLAGDIEDLPIPFFCVSSNLGRGVPHLHQRGALAAALRASVSLPGVFPPAVVDGQLAVDGGILDNLPVDTMRRQPVGKVIAVDVTSRQDFAVDYAAVPSPWSVLAGRLLPFMPRHRVPRFMSLMLKATEIGTMAAVRAAGRRADLLLRPPVARFSLTDVDHFDEIVRAGYEHAQGALDGWRPL